MNVLTNSRILQRVVSGINYLGSSGTHALPHGRHSGCIGHHGPDLVGPGAYQGNGRHRAGGVS